MQAAASVFPSEIQPQFSTRPLQVHPSQVHLSLRRLSMKTVLACSFGCRAELEKSLTISGSEMIIL